MHWRDDIISPFRNRRIGSAYLKDSYPSGYNLNDKRRAITADPLPFREKFFKTFDNNKSDANLLLSNKKPLYTTWVLDADVSSSNSKLDDGAIAVFKSPVSSRKSFTAKSKQSKTNTLRNSQSASTLEISEMPSIEMVLKAKPSNKKDLLTMRKASSNKLKVFHAPAPLPLFKPSFSRGQGINLLADPRSYDYDQWLRAKRMNSDSTIWRKKGNDMTFNYSSSIASLGLTTKAGVGLTSLDDDPPTDNLIFQLPKVIHAEFFTLNQMINSNKPLEQQNSYYKQITSDMTLTDIRDMLSSEIMYGVRGKLQTNSNDPNNQSIGFDRRSFGVELDSSLNSSSVMASITSSMTRLGPIATSYPLTPTLPGIITDDSSPPSPIVVEFPTVPYQAPTPTFQLFREATHHSNQKPLELLFQYYDTEDQRWCPIADESDWTHAKFQWFRNVVRRNHLEVNPLDLHVEVEDETMQILYALDKISEKRILKVLHEKELKDNRMQPPTIELQLVTDALDDPKRVQMRSKQRQQQVSLTAVSTKRSNSPPLFRDKSGDRIVANVLRLGQSSRGHNPHLDQLSESFINPTLTDTIDDLSIRNGRFDGVTNQNDDRSWMGVIDSNGTADTFDPKASAAASSQEMDKVTLNLHSVSGSSVSVSNHQKNVSAVSNARSLLYPPTNPKPERIRKDDQVILLNQIKYANNLENRILKTKW